MCRKMLCLCLAVLFVSAHAGRADDEVPVDKLPKAVVDAIKKKYPNAKLVRAQQESLKKEVIYYEVRIRAGEEEREVVVKPDGEILFVNKQVKAKDLPKAAAAALEGKYPKARYVEVLEVTKGQKVHYEVRLKTADEKAVLVNVDPRGKEIMREIRRGDLPEEVARGLEEKYPEATFYQFAEVYAGKDVYYAVRLTTADRKRTLVARFDAKGKEIEEKKD